MTETELASHVVRWLESQGWEVWEEVQLFAYNQIADIVAKRDGNLWVIETKLGFTLQLLEQIFYWRHQANFVSTATVCRWGRRSHAFVDASLTYFGIGRIEVSLYEPHHVEIKSAAPRHEITRYDLTERLRFRNQTRGLAGSKGQRRQSLPSMAALAVIEYVKLHPGSTLKEVSEGVVTHYTSGSLRAMISLQAEDGILKSIVKRREGGRIRLYSGEEAK